MATYFEVIISMPEFIQHLPGAVLYYTLYYIPGGQRN